FEIALGIAFTSENAHIPVVWSRLNESGTWSYPIKDMEKTGGILVRANGEMSFIRNIAEAVPPLYRMELDGKLSSVVTTNIYQAIPSAPGIGVIGRVEERMVGH